MKKRNLGFYLTLIACPLTLVSCGYSTSRLLPASYRTIYVEPFQNEIPITREVSERTGLFTNVPELEEKVMKAVIDRFLFDGSLQVTSSPEKADLRLTGKLLDFYRQPLRRKDNDTVDEYRLNLSASLALRNRAGKLILEEPAFIADTTYFVTGPLAKTETASVEELSTDFARRVVEWVIEYW